VDRPDLSRASESYRLLDLLDGGRRLLAEPLREGLFKERVLLLTHHLGPLG
jgi:hypothetical protein